MRKLVKEQAEARRLRAEGWALREIANHLEVALSSASVWTRGVDTPPRKPTKRARVRRNGPARAATPEEIVSSETRRCSRCRRDLPLENFGRNRAGRQWYCRECFREYFRVRGKLHLTQSGTAKKARQRAAYQYVRDLKKRSACSVCDETDWRVLELDHLVEKYLSITEFLVQGPGIERLKRELDRCEIVCRNCHRQRTAIDHGSWRLDPDAVERLRNRSRSELTALVWLRDVLAASSCADCGIGELMVLEFDHLRDKAAEISMLVHGGYSIARIEAEAAKCEIVCANCHQVRTIARASIAQAS